MAQTAGVHPFPIAGRVALARERALGMTSIERAWRKQWLQDQILDANEPCDVPEYWKERTNPIRRIYKAVILYRLIKNGNFMLRFHFLAIFNFLIRMTYRIFLSITRLFGLKYKLIYRAGRDSYVQRALFSFMILIRDEQVQATRLLIIIK